MRQKSKEKEKKTKNKKNNEKEQEIRGVDDKTYKLDLLVKKIKFNGIPKLIDLTKDTTLPEKLTEFKCLCNEEDKILYLYFILKQHPAEKFIVFANSIPTAKKIHSILRNVNLPVVCLHSEQQQRQRIKKLEQYTEGVFNILVCTDVASRGLDIPTVNYVIHFQIPRDPDTYVHRSGRTARIGRTGTTYSLVGPQEKTNYYKICKILNREKGLETLELSLKQMDEIRQLVSGATNLEHGEFVLKRQERKRDWYLKNANKAEIVLDDTTQAELLDLEEEIKKKKKYVKQIEQNYKKVKQETEQKLINPSKGKGVFLDPTKISELVAKINSNSSKKTNSDKFTKQISSRESSRDKPKKSFSKSFKK